MGRSGIPALAANEYFCLKAAQKCGLDGPRLDLPATADALVIERFDLRPDGTHRGFEDFCVLNARSTADKYNGSYESSILKRFVQLAESPKLQTDLTKLVVLNCTLRKGDAHLKNFGILYDDVNGEARLAPAYDAVTTTVYFAKDRMALTLTAIQGGQIRSKYRNWARQDAT